MHAGDDVMHVAIRLRVVEAGGLPCVAQTLLAHGAHDDDVLRACALMLAATVRKVGAVVCASSAQRQTHL